MAEQFQTSFIPKRVTETEPKRSFSGSGLTLFVGVLALIVSLLLAGGVFAYDSYLKGAVVRKRDQLQQQREAFAPELIRDMSRLSTKLAIAKQLLDKHIAVSGVFDLLQNITLKTVRFTSFSFANTDKGVQVSMQGEGLSFTSVALQADEFAKNANLSNSIFSAFALSQTGNVTFSVTTVVNPKVISYPENFDLRGAAFIQTTVSPEQAGQVPEDIGVPVSDDGLLDDGLGDLGTLEDLGDDALLDELNGL